MQKLLQDISSVSYPSHPKILHLLDSGETHKADVKINILGRLSVKEEIYFSQVKYQRIFAHRFQRPN